MELWPTFGLFAKWGWGDIIGCLMYWVSPFSGFNVDSCWLCSLTVKIAVYFVIEIIEVIIGQRHCVWSLRGWNGYYISRMRWQIIIHSLSLSVSGCLSLSDAECKDIVREFRNENGVDANLKCDIASIVPFYVMKRKATHWSWNRIYLLILSLSLIVFSKLHRREVLYLMSAFQRPHVRCSCSVWQVCQPRDV